MSGICLLVISGCASVSWPLFDKTAHRADSSQAKSSAAPAKSSVSKPDSDDLKDVMNELQTVGAMDSAARDELIADLKQTDPSRWPLVVQEFRAAAAYRRRIASKKPDDEDRYADRAEPSATTDPSASADAGKGDRPVFADPRPASASPEYAAKTGTVRDDRHHPTRDEYLTPVTLSDNRLATAPDAPLSGGAVAGDTPDRKAPEQAGEARAIATEPPPLSARLAASREQNRPPLPAGESGMNPFSAPQPPSFSPRRGEDNSDLSASGKAELATLTAGLSSGGKSEQAVPLTQADWRAHLAAAIRSMEATSKSGSLSENDVASQARLRMLYLLAGRRDDAMRPLPDAPKATQEYWTSQIYGLSTWMDSERTPDPARRAAETKRILSEAVNQLGDTAPLTVRNLTFCTAVRYYGSFDAAKAEFTPGQKVMLYAEVENFHMEPTTKGFRTSVKFSWQIFDARGSRISDYASASSEEDSLTPKHEFFVTKWFFLPGSMADGRYTLQFTVEDVLGHKVGQSSVEMTIK